MAIYTRNAEGKFVPLNIPTLKGEKGQDGVTPNFTIGTVTTLDPGQQVTVGIRGDKENPILDFGIPRGQDGAGGGANNIFDADIEFVPDPIVQIVEAPNGTPIGTIMDRYVRVESYKSIKRIGVQVRGFDGQNTIASNVKAYAVNADTHEVMELLHDQTGTTPIETIEGQTFAMIDVNKTYDVNTVFAFGIARTGDYANGSGLAIQEGTDKNLISSKNAPTVGERLAEWTSSNWTMGVYVEFESEKVGSLTKEVANEVAKINNSTEEYQLFSAVRGDFDNSTAFRIPAIVVTPKGTIIAASDIRRNSAHDQTLIDNGISRSTDGGKTWTQKVVMVNSGVSNLSRVMDSTMLSVKNGDVYILCGAWDSNRDNWESTTVTPDPDWKVRLAKSTDDGITWTETDISKTTLNQPQDTVSWLGGVGTGIEMADGTLVFPIQICRRDTATNSNYVTAGIIYSKDGGTTWSMSTSFTPRNNRISENMVAEVEDGMLVLTGRNESSGVRPAYFTTDLGATWQPHDFMHNLINTNARPCQGSFITLDTLNGQRVGLVSTPTSGGGLRRDLGVTLIDFNTKKTKLLKVFFPLPYVGGGYSSLATGFYNGRRILVVAYEAQGQIHYQDLTYLLNDIELLTSGSVNLTIISNDEIDTIISALN